MEGPVCWLPMECSGDVRGHGEAVQVDRVETSVESASFQRMKLLYDEPLSNAAFNFNLRRYITVLSGLTNGATVVWKLSAEVGGSLFRTSIRPTMNRGTRAARMYEHLHTTLITGAKAEAWCLLIHADASLSVHITLKVSHAPMLGEWLFATTLLRGLDAVGGARRWGLTLVHF